MSTEHRYILHIDTATSVCSVAISDKDELKAYLIEEESNQHTRVINLMVERLLKESGIDLNDIEAISVATGPGSYTGLRVGLSAAKGLAYALGIKIIPLSSLDSLAQQFKDAGKHIVSCIDARRNEIYLAIYDTTLTKLSEDNNLIIEEGVYPSGWPAPEDLIICGNGAMKTGELLKNFQIEVHNTFNDARNQSSLAFKLLIKGKLDDIAYVKPNYLKPPNITKPRKSTVL